MAQQLTTGFPTTKVNDDFQQRLARQGTIWSTDATSQGTIWSGQSGAGGQGLLSASPATPSGFDYYINSVSFSSTRPILAQSLIGYFGSLGNYPIQVNGFVVPVGTITLPVNAVIRSGMVQPSFSLLDLPEANPLSILAIANNNLNVTKSTTTVVSSTLRTYSTTVSVKNNTSATASGVTTVIDTLPSGCSFVSATGSGWTFSAVSNSITAVTGATFGVGSTLTYTMTVTPTVTFDVGFSTSGYLMDTDNNWNARPLMVCGTSIEYGTGITDFRQNHIWLLRNWVRDTYGVNTRVVNKSISGTQTVQHEDLRANLNWYDLSDRPNIFVYSHGINDFVQGVTASLYVSNVLSMVKYVRNKTPDCQIFILSPFPTGNATNESGLVALRAALAAGISGLPAGDLIYTHFISSTGTLWNPVTQDSQYTTDGIHLNAAARLLVVAAIKSYITSNNVIINN